MVPSPDGATVAYTWMTPNAPTELRLMTLPTGTPRILRAEPERHAVRPVAWSGDGRDVLVVATSADGISTLEFVAVGTGTTTRLPPGNRPRGPNRGDDDRGRGVDRLRRCTGARHPRHHAARRANRPHGAGRATGG